MMYTKVLGWQKHTSVLFPFFFLSFPSVKMKNLAAVQTVNQTISADHSSEEEKEKKTKTTDKTKKSKPKEQSRGKPTEV